MRPTCGPLPWVSTSPTPLATSSARGSTVAARAARISSTDPVAVGGESALPPSATTTRTGARLEQRQHVPREVAALPDDVAADEGHDRFDDARVGERP